MRSRDQSALLPTDRVWQLFRTSQEPFARVELVVEVAGLQAGS